MQFPKPHALASPVADKVMQQLHSARTKDLQQAICPQSKLQPSPRLLHTPTLLHSLTSQVFNCGLNCVHLLLQPDTGPAHAVHAVVATPEETAAAAAIAGAKEGDPGLARTDSDEIETETWYTIVQKRKREAYYRKLMRDLKTRMDFYR